MYYQLPKILAKKSRGNKVGFRSYLPSLPSLLVSLLFSPLFSLFLASLRSSFHCSFLLFPAFAQFLIPRFSPFILFFDRRISYILRFTFYFHSSYHCSLFPSFFFSSLHSSNFLFSMLHLSLPFQLPLLSLHPFPRRFSSSLHSPNFSSSTLHLSFLFQLPVLFLHPFSFFPVFVEFLVPYTSPFILDAFFFSLHPSNFSPTLLIFHSCPNYHCSLFLRRFFSFKFFIIPSFSLSFYPLSSRSSSFPLFFLPPLSVHLDAFFLPSPNPLRYAATTYFSFSR